MSTLKIKPAKNPAKLRKSLQAAPIMGPKEDELNQKAVNDSFARYTEIAEKEGTPAAIATAMGDSFGIGMFFQAIDFTDGWLQTQKAVSKALADNIKVAENANKPV